MSNVQARLSVFSTHSQASLDYLPSASTPPPISAASSSTRPFASSPALQKPRGTIYDRPINKTRTAEVSASAYAFLFSEMIQYTQKRVHGIGDLEKRYATCSPSLKYSP